MNDAHVFALLRAGNPCPLLRYRTHCFYVSKQQVLVMLRSHSGSDWMKSSILASRQAASISPCVTADSGLVAPSKILKRIVPIYKVCKVNGQPYLLRVRI